MYIFDLRISGQYLIEKNCNISRTSDAIDIKLGPVTILEKKNKTMPKSFDDEAKSASCHVILIFPIKGQFGIIHKLDCKTYIFITSSFLP